MGPVGINYIDPYGRGAVGGEGELAVRRAVAGAHGHHEAGGRLRGYRGEGGAGADGCGPGGARRGGAGRGAGGGPRRGCGGGRAGRELEVGYRLVVALP